MTVWKVIVHYAFLTVHCHRFAMTSPSFPIKVINIYKKTEKNAFSTFSLSSISLCRVSAIQFIQHFKSHSSSHFKHNIQYHTPCTHTMYNPVIFKCGKYALRIPGTLLYILLIHYKPITLSLCNLLKKVKFRKSMIWNNTQIIYPYVY